MHRYSFIKSTVVVFMPVENVAVSHPGDEGNEAYCPSKYKVHPFVRRASSVNNELQSHNENNHKSYPELNVYPTLFRHIAQLIKIWLLCLVEEYSAYYKVNYVRDHITEDTTSGG